MDLSNLELKEDRKTAVLHVENPSTGELLYDEETKEPVTIAILSQDASEIVKARQRISDRAIKARMSGRQMGAEEVEKSSLDLLVAATKGWSHIVIDGDKLACTPDNIRMVYTRISWLREQVFAFSSDLRNFLGNSSSAS